ncbi:signal peptidase I [Alkaliphilus serpentinus]|uniref:Signal peptidase I n=1 Tax=Alkaliphilus serpentinus TaxID=1482731 RepID=A0A833HR66_9FIRM|nr:signal peptidase I [Alkaliphilus serpentinus]KAB3533093.1 signal peptidase I [Alkaliphilus serpentinus]
MKKTLSFLLEWLQIISIALFLALVIENYLFSFAVVQGKSMEPTIKQHDRLLVLKHAVFKDHLEEGDIIVFHPPGTNKELFVKRVVAKEKDSYAVEGVEVFVNDEKLGESYVADMGYLDRSYNYLEGTVPKDSFYVLGDNRNDSNDSRTFGYIKQEQIVGKVVFRIWPIKDARVFINNNQ